MKTILVALGNPLRGDDGVARLVVDMLDPSDAEIVISIQPTPELAGRISNANRVIFIDADIREREPRLEKLAPPAAHRSPIGHAVSPAETVELARRLFGFSGEAWICRVPVGDFSASEQLSPTAKRNARRAAAYLSTALH